MTSSDRLLKTEKKTIVLGALGDGKFSLSAQGIDKPITIMADEVFEVRANAKQLVLLRKSRNYDPSDHDDIVTLPGRSDHWLKIKNPAAPAVRRLEEEDW